MIPRSATLLLLSSLHLLGQPSSPSNWQKLGGYTFDAGLASPATGSVASVWFSLDGSTLYARTSSGAVWQTSDFGTWSPSSSPAPRPRQFSPDARAPEFGSRVISTSSGSIYSLGFNLFRSDDNGASWVNLTGFNGRSVIGAGQSDLAVSPKDPLQIVVANSWGVWASHDAGLSWTGLNERLPNLKISEIVAAGNTAGSGVKAAIAGVGPVELLPGDSVWRAAGAAAELSRLSKNLNTTITAFAAAGETAYAGSADGRLWTSRDRQATWTLSTSVAGGPVERIFADAAYPGTAFAAASGKSHSLLRTINTGGFWDDVTGNLTENPAHALVADRSSGFLFAATDRGVFLARSDLNALGPVPAWTALPGLPESAVRDVKISGIRLYAAVDNYGIYVRSTPQLTGTVRLVSAADQSERPAAPGSLYSVIGQRLGSASSGSLKIPILASSDDESQIQIPFEATGQQLSLNLDQRVMALPLKPVSPAIFLDKDGAPMLLDSETGLLLEARASLHANGRIQILATGLGRTEPAWPTAVPAPLENPPSVTASLQLFLNGNPVEITRSTLAPGYVGLYLVEFTIPVLIDSGVAELYLSAGSQESNRVRVYLQSQ